MSEAVFVDNSVDYSTKISHHGNIKMVRIKPINTSTVTLSTGATSTQEILFELPTGSRTINFSKCSFSFEMDVAAHAATKATVLHSLGLAMLGKVEIYTKSGQRLADLSDFNDYHRAVAPYLTKFADYKTNPTGRGAASVATTPERGFNVFSSQAALSAVSSAAHARTGARPITVPTQADVPFDEPQYLVASGVDAAIQVKYNVPFKQLFHTLGALDQDIFFGENIFMGFHMAGSDRIGYACTAPTSSLAQVGLITAAVTIVSPEVRLATETNPDIADALVAKARSGFSIRTPYVQRHGKTLSTGIGDHQIRLNRKYGSRLLNVYSCLFDATNTGILAQDLNNLADIKETDFQSRMNENRLQEYKVDISEGQDYEILKNTGILDGSVVSTQNMYAFNRLWIDSWRSKKACEWNEDNNDSVVDGYNLDSECMYTINKDVAAGTYRHYLFTVCQREISVAPNGVQIQ